MFDNIVIENQEDLIEINRVGGGSRVTETGEYTIIIEKAYVDTADSGALNFIFEGKTESGEVLRHNDYIVAGDAKGNKAIVSTFPKYNSLAKLIAGKELISLVPVEAEIMVYDFDLKKEVPTKKKIIKELIGKPITVLMTKKREFKQAKNEKTNQYEDTEETRDSLELNCFVDPVSKKTLAEKSSGDSAEFIKKWLEKNTSDYFIDKTNGATPKPKAAAGSNAGQTATKTFGVNKG
jgi:hypothetical protein